jgi:hypothetical protein
MMPAPNATCDIYRHNNLLGSPDVAGVRCNLKPDFRAGQRLGDRANTNLCWTHLLLVEMSVDIRDNYGGAGAPSNVGDLVYFGPRATATMFRVVYLEKVNDYKRAYLDRASTPSWPTNDV